MATERIVTIIRIVMTGSMITAPVTTAAAIMAATFTTEITRAVVTDTKTGTTATVMAMKEPKTAIGTIGLNLPDRGDMMTTGKIITEAIETTAILMKEKPAIMGRTMKIPATPTGIAARVVMKKAAGTEPSEFSGILMM